MRRFLPILSFVLAACVGSSVPQPPNLDPIDPMRIQTPTGLEAAGAIEIRANSGAAPANAQVTIWNLETSAPPTRVTSAPDGSFVAFLDRPITELRLEAARDGERSRPVDVVFADETAIEVLRPSCFRVPSVLELEAGAGTLAIENICASDIPVRNARLRAGDGFDVEVFPAAIASGSTLEISVTTSSTAAEEIHLLSVEIGGVPLRYPTTFRVLSP
jgi:hypothetical protein